METMATTREAFDLWVVAAGVHAAGVGNTITVEQYVTLNELLARDVQVTATDMVVHDYHTRDALLAHIANHPDSVDSFISLIDSVGQTVADVVGETAAASGATEEAFLKVLMEATAPAATMLGACHYLKGDYETARGIVEYYAATYSLASLLRVGLEHSAPAELLRRSFTAFSVDSLLED